MRALVAVVAVCSLAAGCGGGDDDSSCGPGSAAGDGLVASGGSAVLTFGDLTAGQNNDCPAAGSPAGVISLTIQGTQSDGSGAITMCVARPDQLATQSLALGADVAGSPVRLVDLGGTSTGCTFALDPTTPPTGTVSAAGLCGAGSGSAGFALTVAGTAQLSRTCAGTTDTVSVTLTGTVAVEPGA